MSARSFRRPRNSKTQSSLLARGPGLGEKTPTPVPWLLGLAGASGIPASPRGSCRTGPLQASSSGSLTLGRSPLGAHCAMLLSNHPALAPSLLFDPGTFCPGCRARLELMRWFPGAGAHWGHWELARVRPCLCSAPPFLLSCSALLGSGCRRCLANEPETTSSGAWCLGFSMGKVTL